MVRRGSAATEVGQRRQLIWGRGAIRPSDEAAPAPAASAGVLTPAEILSPRLRAALEGIGEAIVVYDSSGGVLFQNGAAAQLLTPRPSDALVVQAVSDVAREALSGARPERRLDLISPTRRSLSVRAFPLDEQEGDDGGADGAVVVVEDVSERLRLESVRRDFVANVSHELKTPIGALTLLAETIDGETDPEVIARLARRMGSEAERLSLIIDDLLDLSRIESDEAPARVPVRVTDLVTEAVGCLHPHAAEFDVTVESPGISPDLVVLGDRRDLVSAVANLVDNAVKYSEPGGVVRVTAETSPNGVAISVADSGVGIPSRDLERIFERFYRVDRARSRATGGTGLGLSIVRHVAANHGGSVRVSSVEGEGSTFVLELPSAPGCADGAD